MIFAQSDPFTTADAITLGIASLGAFTGIASLAITISQFWLSGPRVRVTISAGWSLPNGISVTGGDSWDIVGLPKVVNDSVKAVVVTATNRGRIAATITGWGLVFGKEKNYHTPNLTAYSELPARIEAGDSRSFGMPLQQFIEATCDASRDADRTRHEVRGRVNLGDGRKLRSRESLTIPTD